MDDLLAELNRDLWHPFVRSYDERDTDAFAALYHADTIRATGAGGGSVMGRTEFIRQLAGFFATATNLGGTVTIAFRFHERIAAGVLASERGVFRLTVTPAGGTARVRYGLFHTYARRTDGRWLFVADYDTPEGADEGGFAAGAEIDDLARFTA
jgi:uncharacterized protein (TIGR02246 family)